MTIDANLLYGVELGFALGVLVTALVVGLVFVAVGREVRFPW